MTEKTTAIHLTIPKKVEALIKPKRKPKLTLDLERRVGFLQRNGRADRAAAARLSWEDQAYTRTSDQAQHLYHLIGYLKGRGMRSLLEAQDILDSHET